MDKHIIGFLPWGLSGILLSSDKSEWHHIVGTCLVRCILQKATRFQDIIDRAQSEGKGADRDMSREKAQEKGKSDER